MILEIKGCSLDLKDIDASKREVYFYFSNFDTKDADKHVVQRGAFSKSASEGMARMKHFRNHNDKNNYGKIFLIQEDQKGAFAGSKIKRGAEGDQMLMDYEDGIITEHSFGAYPIKQKFSKELDATIKTEYQLMEVSSLDAWGSNKNTPLIALKGFEDLTFRIKDLKDYIENNEFSIDEINTLDKKTEAINLFIKSLKNSEPNKATLLNLTEPMQQKAVDYNFLLKNI